MQSALLMRRFAERHEQPVAGFRHRPNVTRRLGAIAESAAELGNGLCQNFFTDDDIGPNPVHQTLAGNDGALCIDQRHQHTHSLVLEALRRARGISAIA